jgi:hypothetical protein
MRFVSTALVMMTMALMLLALMLLGPAAHAKSDDLCSEPWCANKSPPNNSQTTEIEMPRIVATALPDRVTLMEL